MKTKVIRKHISEHSYVECTEVYVEDVSQYLTDEHSYDSLTKIFQNCIEKKRIPILAYNILDIKENKIEEHLRLAQMLNVKIQVYLKSSNFEKHKQQLSESAFNADSTSVPFEISKFESHIL